MIQFKISKPPRGDDNFYEEYSRFIFSRVKHSVEKSADPLKYKARVADVLSSSVIKWDGDPPPSFIDLRSYVIRCLVMVKVKGEYVIKINESQRVHKSRTKVSTLVRLLEYGNERVLAYPVITRVLMHYQKIYPYLVKEFLTRRW